MSASSKKKLRKEQEAAKLTEKQLAEQKEARTTRLYTIIFVTAMVLILAVAIFVGINQTIASNGIREKNTVALTVGDHEISSAELSYYYIDSVNQMGSYASMFGIDTTRPLNEQFFDEEAGQTWADYFLNNAKDQAHATYAVVAAAEAAGYTLPQAEQDQIDASMANLSTYALIYGYKDTTAYLKVFYGNGASEAGYREYLTSSALASSYYQAYSNGLTYEDADLRAKEAENFGAYSSYTYNTYYLDASRFLEGGTTDSEGTVTYSDEEKAASVAAAEEAAKTLTAEEIATVEDLDAAIAALAVNADTTAASAPYTNASYTSIAATYRDWLTDSSRKEGDISYFANDRTTTDENGTETTVTNGYYVVRFASTNENNFPLANVRHILVAFEGGTADEYGNTTYTDEEKAAAKTEAEALLEQWKSGDATEDSFAALANEKSDDGDGTTGGLYENVYPGQMVTNFNDWCFDESRKAGDVDIVETQYGYHVMYFVGNSDVTYRNYLIETELRSADAQSWYTELLDTAVVIEGNTKHLPMDLVLTRG